MIRPACFHGSALCERRDAQIFIRCLVFTLLLLMMPALRAQTNPSPAVPPQIASARTVFLSNAGEEEKANSERIYKRLWTALSHAGQYKLVASPVSADLILETHYSKRPDRSGTNESGVVRYVYFIRLDVLDRATHVTLWSVTEYLDLLSNQFQFDPALDAATDALLADLRALGAGKFPTTTSSPDKG